MHFKNSLVRFKNNKPFVLKKTLVTLAIIAFIIYSYAQLNLIFAIVFTAIIGLTLVIKIRKQPTEGKGVFGKLKTFYKNLYRQFIVDVLPIDVKITTEQLSITLNRAEIIKRHIVNEKFVIKKDKIAGILYDDTDEDLLILFEEASITAKDIDTDKVIRQLFQFNSAICFRIKDDTSIVQNLINEDYPVEKLSEIQDEEEETEDPELLNKENADSNTEIFIENTQNEIAEQSVSNTSEFDSEN